MIRLLRYGGERIYDLGDCGDNDAIYKLDDVIMGCFYSYVNKLNTVILTRICVDVEQSLFVAGDDGVQDPATRPRILVGRLDDGQCVVRCHADVPRDGVAGSSEDRCVVVDVMYVDCDQRRRTR